MTDVALPNNSALATAVRGHQDALHGSTLAAGREMTALSKYARYGLAGAICASATHVIMVPVDVVKTRLQLSPGLYSGMGHAFRQITKAEGYSALLLGLTPTMIGYCIQGGFKFAGFEFFKHLGAKVLGDDVASNNKTALYLAASATAEVIGTAALCPWEAIRIRMVSQPDFASSSFAGLKKIYTSEGTVGLYKGLGPILLKQVPYTMTQLTVFQHITSYTYNVLLPKLTRFQTKEQLGTSGQLGVSVVCGTIAGVTSAIASHPADTVLSRINAKEETARGGTVSQRLARIVRELGFRGVWYGIVPRCVMVGALSAGMFLIYDSVKVACGLPIITEIQTKQSTQSR